MGKRALEACFVPVAEHRVVVLPDLLECAQHNKQEASVALGNLLRVPLKSLVLTALTVDRGADGCGSRKTASHGKMDPRREERVNEAASIAHNAGVVAGIG